jgi:hypothetical protein
MAYHGGSMRAPGGETPYLIQQQLSNDWVGNKTCLEALDCGGTPCPGIGSTGKATESLPFHPDAYCREAYGHSRHPLAVFWQQPRMALQVQRGITNTF